MCTSLACRLRLNKDCLMKKAWKVSLSIMLNSLWDSEAVAIEYGQNYSGNAVRELDK